MTMINGRSVEKTHDNVSDLIINLKLRIESLELQLANSRTTIAPVSDLVKLTDDELKMIYEQF
ncbi:hypothetical protein [Shewanella atlantica]|uniref:Uncharacterized protein n=1 Tax=Shewanella atlantica TaxID=271099 RepID=A0A3S0LDL8_9GAMM|nr:hypothetical protein [Shewanella atlantica]RTR32890.1 hypothetical protein EKG39_11045 [Shewanella atlantica]